MKKIWILIFLLVLVAVGAGGYWYWSQTAIDVALHILYFPKEVYSDRYSYGDYSVTEDLHNNQLTFQNLKTKETKTISARAIGLAVGDGFVAYITESKNEPIDQKGNTIAVFELRLHDFNTAEEFLLIPHIPNNNNPNGPQLSISGRQILVSGYGNNLTFCDLDKKSVRNIQLAVGEKTRDPNESESVFNITPGVYDIIPPHTFLVGNSVVFEADVFGSENALFLYNTVNETYRKLHSSYNFFAEMYYSNNYIYWDEVEMWSPTLYYKLKVKS